MALLRCTLGALVLWPLAGGRTVAGDGARVAAMGLVGFAAAYALTNWGLVRSTATNAALLIVVEPIAMLLLAPIVLGERLRAREAAGAALALAGALAVVVNGIPGLTSRVVPYWTGDLLLILSGVAFAAYSLIGRPVLGRQAPLPVTMRSLAWGAAALLPLTGAEWLEGRRPVWTGAAVLGVLYLGVVLTGLAYVVWNWALQEVGAGRAAVSLNLQPVVGAALGVLLLGEPLTPFTVAGGLAIVAGVWLALGPPAILPADGARGADP
jgi:drug/metabolite transporter (DMT)-like permease